MSTPVEFAAWLTKNAPRLRAVEAEQAADEIGDAILAVDPRLGAEVADPIGDEAFDAGDRELVLTAFSDRSAFALVRELARAIGRLPAWSITALKPPRGFDFSVAVGDVEVDARTLTFSPDPSQPNAVRLLVPSGLIDLADTSACDEIARLIVEGGLGEELASTLAGVELVDRESVAVGRSMTELAAYVTALTHR